jgi:apolipoprotein N-acyltransferase
MTAIAGADVISFGARLNTWPAWRIHALCLLAGALAVLGHAPFHIAPAYMVGLIGLVWALDGAHHKEGRRFSAAFARTWWWGFGHFIGGLFWVGSAFTQVEGAMALMPVAVASLAGGIALVWAAAGAAAMLFWTDGIRRIPVFVTVIMLAEIVRGALLFGGFPWNLPGEIWPAGGAMSQVAAFVGIYGLSAITLLLFAAPATLGEAGRGIGRKAIPMMAAALTLGLLWGAGVQRLAQPLVTPLRGQPPAPVVRVADPGFTQKEKWTVGPVAVLERYLELTDPPVGARSDIVIWPEGAVPTYSDTPDLVDWSSAMDAIGRQLGDRVLVVGAVKREPRIGGGEKQFNSAFVIDGVASVASVFERYDKHHLVPFGEYMPFWELYSGVPLAPLQQIGRGFDRGPRPTRVVIPGAGTAVILICYESIFPAYVPGGEERPDWIINITNDAWFGGLTGPWQHFNAARFRAIESGLPMARAAAGGVSAIIDPYGRPVVATQLDGGAVEASLPNALPETIFSRFSQWLVPLLLIIIAALRFAPPGAPARGLRS